MKKNIILGITGSIAAYKAADLTSRLTKNGHNVHVVMTASAQEFITPLTLQTLSRQPVTTGVFSRTDNWEPEHIDIADRADLLVVAPATANCIAKLAQGIADDSLSSIALACQAPVLIAPAMNGKMWQHPATQANVAVLRARHVTFLGPEENGMLACGYEGIGRMQDVDSIEAAINELLAR